MISQASFFTFSS